MVIGRNLAWKRGRFTSRSDDRRRRASRKWRRARGGTHAAANVAHQGLMASLALDMAIQGVGWMVSSTWKTEKFFDLLGTGSFLALSLQGSQFPAAQKNPKAKLIAGMVGTWAVRLGTFLVARVFRTGGDSRFDDAKTNPLKFLVYWSMQGVWVFVTALPMLLVQTQGIKSGWTCTDVLGFMLWTVGFMVESTADLQKWRFRQIPSNKGKFIQTGLWKYSRHPNYFGEMVLWFGIWMSSISSLPNRGLNGIALASPLFVTFLLCKVSGVPLLEEAADAKWGNLRGYQEYKQGTRLLLPIPK